MREIWQTRSEQTAAGSPESENWLAGGMSVEQVERTWTDAFLPEAQGTLCTTANRRHLLAACPVYHCRDSSFAHNVMLGCLKSTCTLLDTYSVGC